MSRFVACQFLGAGLGALAAWLLAGGMESGLQLFPLAGGAAWGAACGLVLALDLTLLRPVLLRGPGPAAAFAVEAMILAPLMYAGGVMTARLVLAHQSWMDRPWQSAETWFSGLAFLLLFTLVDAIGLMAQGTRRITSPVPAGRIIHAEGYLLAVSLCPPPGQSIKNDAEQQLLLTQLAHKLLTRHGAGLLGLELRVCSSDLILFIPGRSNYRKNAVFPLVQRCMKSLARQAASHRSEFGFVPRLSMVLHFGTLVHARPSPTSHEGIGASPDLSMVLLAEKEARSRPCSLWVSDSALNKIMLPKSFRITGSTALKVREGMTASRMFFVAWADPAPRIKPRP